MKIFPQNAFPLPIIADEKKKKGTLLFGIKKFHFWKKIVCSSSQTLFCLGVTEVLSGLCAGKVDRSWLWHMCRDRGRSSPGHTGFGEWGCDKVSQKLMKGGAFSTEKPALAQKYKMRLCRASKPHPWLLPCSQSSFSPNSEFGQDCSPPVDFLPELLLYCGFGAEPPAWKLINIPEDTPEQEIIVLLWESGVNRISLLSKTPSGKRKLSS